MKEVRYERHLPRDIVERRTAAPVAYLAIGGVEWHGEHLAVGNDVLKGHALCCRAARLGGGLVMPPLYWGEPRGEEILESGHDHDGRVAEKMSIPKANFGPGYMRKSHDEEYEFYVQLLLHIFRELDSLEFRVVMVCCGHYPLIHEAREAAERFAAESDMRVFPFIGFDLAEDLGYRGDHAGRWETALLMALEPDLVDLSPLGEDRSEAPIGVFGDDPRDASAEFGREAVEAVVQRMVEKANSLLKEAGSR